MFTFKTDTPQTVSYEYVFRQAGRIGHLKNKYRMLFAFGWQDKDIRQVMPAADIVPMQREPRMTGTGIRILGQNIGRHILTCFMPFI